MTASPLIQFTETDPNQISKVPTINQMGLDIESATLGQIALAMADADVVPTTAQLKNFTFSMTGANTAMRNVTLPTAKRHYYFINATTGGFGITVKTSGGAGVYIPPGGEAWVRCDGTNIVQMIEGLLTPARVYPAVGGASFVAGVDYAVIVRKSVGSATAFGLPAPASGLRFLLKDGKGDAAANPITVTPSSGTIDGAATFVLNTAYESAGFLGDGTQWNVT